MQSTTSSLALRLLLVCMCLFWGCSSGGSSEKEDAQPHDAMADSVEDGTGDTTPDVADATDLRDTEATELAPDTQTVCQYPDECPVGYACVDGQCTKACKRSPQCAAGMACLASVCSPCEQGPDCDGLACNMDSGKCEPCESAEECLQQYADQFEYECVEGSCSPKTCDSDADCFLVKQVCDEEEHRCVACNDSSFKCSENSYTDAACIDGLCTSPGGTICTEHAMCSQDSAAPICGTNHVCRACAQNSECLETIPQARAVVSAICTSGGKCVAGGECGGLEGTKCMDLPDAEDGLVCNDSGPEADFRCVPCSSHEQCAQDYPGGLCIEGRCHLNVTCDGQDMCDQYHTICNATHNCVTCTTLGVTSQERHAACKKAYSPDGTLSYICSEQGECLQGQCITTSDCSLLFPDEHRVCNQADFSCLPCTSLPADVRDAACSQGFGDSFICEPQGCVVGCTPGGICLQDMVSCAGHEGMVCGADRRWRGCDSDSECKTLSGNVYHSCNAGERCEGECTTALDCSIKYGSGLLCSSDHICVECIADDIDSDGTVDGDFPCRMAYSNPTFVCEPDILVNKNLCRSGCKPNQKDCLDGLVCSQFSSHCIPCVADGNCTSEYGYGFVCEQLGEGVESKRCVDACDDAELDCGAGEVCIGGHCTGCVSDADCDQAYTTPQLCQSGLCMPGDCRPSDPSACVGAGFTRLCIANFCTDCNSHGVDFLGGACGAGDVCCPSGSVCDNGKCYFGDCCTGAGCDNPVPMPCSNAECVNHGCNCASDSDCWSQYPDCVQHKGGVCVDNHCRTLDDLVRQYGDGLVVHSDSIKRCLLKDTVYEKDPITGVTPDPHYSCFAEGEYYDDPSTKEDESACLRCWTTGSVASYIAPTPGTGSGTLVLDRCYIDDPQTEDADPRCYVAGPAPDGVVFSDCKVCAPSLADPATLHSWVPAAPEGLANDWASRVPCTDPWYFGTEDNPIAEGAHKVDGSAAYPYSGSMEGRCWQTMCRGMSWLPYLPVGFNGAATTTPVTIGGQQLYFQGAFGGGFGAVMNPSGL